MCFNFGSVKIRPITIVAVCVLISLACCLIQNECRNCTNIYHVNSVAYCCPGCQGNLMVTALQCSCKITYTDPNRAPTCAVSNTIVGDYPYRKPSYYYATGSHVASSNLCWLSLIVGSFVLFLKF
jgi:hypothetical protein